jgi:hypothetical protein
MVSVGKDEFCLSCMEWQECDENGRCTVCGKFIKKKGPGPQKIDYETYRIEDAAYEVDEDAS